MSEQRNVRVFISWSGDLAREVAVALREWLPLLFDRVEPWASDTDIAAGQRGLAQIEAELSDTEFGVVVITSANQHAPWLNFEAGALSKTIQGDVEHRVVPLMVDLSGPSQLTGPLAQFQAKPADRDGVLSLLRSLAAVAGIDERVATARFDAYWSTLEEKIDAAKQTTSKGRPTQPRRDQADVLDEILLHVRALRSESEAGGSASRKALARTAAEEAAVRAATDSVTLEDFTRRLAATYNLQVHGIDRPRKDFLDVTVAPKGEFSKGAAEEFERALREQVPWNVRVVSIPF